MSEELIIELRPAGEDLSLVLRGSMAPRAADLHRPPLTIAREQLEELRSGEAGVLLASRVAHEVSEWLLGKDLRFIFDAALARGDPFRVVLQPSEVRLADALADIPFELLQLEADDPLAFRPNVQSIVHRLPKVGAPRSAPGNRDWPLNVLIVRSNPTDLGGAVPPARPVRDALLGLAIPRFGADNVQVRLVSNEPDVAVPATWERLQDELVTGFWDILVFLGHGDVAPGFEELPPSGVLKLEEADGKTPRSISAEQLRIALQQHPVPVVILAGCLTAAHVPAADMKALKERLPRWMRGGQGVAQDLVNSESGVQVAVGMRYRLETTDAECFLEAFFKSLLAHKCGDLEAAVQAGRGALHARRPFPPSWSAPVMYGAPAKEPMFDFLARAPNPAKDPHDNQDQAYRVVAWDQLSRLPLANRTPGVADLMYQVLEQADGSVLQRSLEKQVPVAMPTRFETAPGGVASVGIRLHGTLDAEVLKGRVVFSDRTLVAQAYKSSGALKDAGFKALFDGGEPGELRFLLERTAGPGGAAAGPLPQDALFSLDLPAGGVAQRVYTVDVVDLTVQPFRAVRGWSNAVIVSPP
jgi:hypothetical protein